jgi:hypothetical protein
MNVQPYLSIVGWARNDGYTDDYISRANAALNFLVRQLNRHRVASEVIIVEWNPPTDRPLMSELLTLPTGHSEVTVRFVTVDGRFHRGARGWQARGMHGSNAANVGFRRARGRFVTSKATDTFYSEALVRRIAAADLDEAAVYRCDRVDVRAKEGWLEQPDELLLEELARNVVLRHDRLSQSNLWKIRDLHTNACGDFMLMSVRTWHAIRGFQKDPTVLCLDADSIALHAAAAHGAREVHWQGDCHILKIVHGNTHAQRTATVWKNWQRSLDSYVFAKNYPELAIKLRIWLDYPRRRVRGMEDILAPSIERNFLAKAIRYATNETSLVTNSADWGLANETLPEKIVMRAGWDTA